MRRTLQLVTLLALALGARHLHGNEPIKPTIEVHDLRVVYKYASTAELVRLQRQHGARTNRGNLQQNHRQGFSILRRNNVTGAFTCEIYLAKERQPRMVDDDATLTLGHELLHCLLGDYHE